jgi:Multiubiquitin
MNSPNNLNTDVNCDFSVPQDDFVVEVNRTDVHLADPVPQAQQILCSAGFEPADDHVLIQVLHHETRAIGLDETVDLRVAGKKSFRAFRNDRIFRFTIDGRGYDWGSATIDIAELRVLSGIKDDLELILDREDAECILQPGCDIDLSQPGTEHIRSVSRLITVYLNGEKKEIPRGVYTTEQLITALHVEPGYLLNLLDDDGQLITLKPGEKLRVKEDMKFFTQVPCGASS